MPDRKLDNKRGILVGENDVGWTMAPTRSGQVQVMLDSLEVVAVPSTCVVPCMSLHEAPPRKEARSYHDTTEDGCRRDRSYTTHHGGGLTTGTTVGSVSKDGFAALNAAMRSHIMGRRRSSAAPGSSRKSSHR
jgi:hypothetical protein